MVYKYSTKLTEQSLFDDKREKITEKLKKFEINKHIKNI